jgi:hypothetical protein
MEFAPLNEWLQNFGVAKATRNIDHICENGIRILSDNDKEEEFKLFVNIVPNYSTAYDYGRYLMNCLMKYLFTPMLMDPTPLINKEVMQSFLFINLGMIENDVDLMKRELSQSSTRLRQFKRLMDADVLLGQYPFPDVWSAVNEQDAQLTKLVQHTSDLIRNLNGAEEGNRWNDLLSINWRKQQIKLFMDGMSNK